MKPSPILIKKYGNRRLYDTTSSRYVNLDDLAAHIRAGREVKVVDAKTGQLTYFDLPAAGGGGSRQGG